MPRSRAMQIGIVLALVAVVLAILAATTDVPDWLIVVLFVGAAVAAHFGWPGKRTDE